jgi:hypothetical protein
MSPSLKRRGFAGLPTNAPKRGREKNKKRIECKNFMTKFKKPRPYLLRFFFKRKEFYNQTTPKIGISAW